MVASHQTYPFGGPENIKTNSHVFSGSPGGGIRRIKNGHTNLRAAKCEQLIRLNCRAITPKKQGLIQTCGQQKLTCLVPKEISRCAWMSKQSRALNFVLYDFKVVYIEEHLN